MALQLIDLNAEVSYIEVDASRVPYSFTVKLADRTYAFTIKYNDEGGFFTIDLFDVNGEVLAFGEVVRYGRPVQRRGRCAVSDTGNNPVLYNQRRYFGGHARELRKRCEIVSL